MRNELLDDAIAAIRAAGYEPKVERNRHIKVSWSDGSGRERCLTISVSPSSWRARMQSRSLLKRLLTTQEDRTGRMPVALKQLGTS